MTVSVVITAFNRPDGLNRSLASLAQQTRIPDETLVYANPSSADLESVALRWRSAFPQFRFHLHPTNIGLCGNLNAGISAATGDYIANLHDDDTFDSMLLEKWENALNQYPTAGFVFCRVGGRNAKTEGKLADCPPYMVGRNFNKCYFINSWRGSSPVWGTVMARRSAYLKLLPFDSKYGAITDVDMWMRMCCNFNVAYINERLINADAPSMFTAPHGANWSMLKALQKIHRNNIDRYIIQGSVLEKYYLIIRHYLIFYYLWILNVQSEIRNKLRNW